MESITWPENLLNDRKKAIHELLRGREFTNQLGAMLRGPLPAGGSVSAEDLLVKIMGSFRNTISILDSSESDEVSQIPASSRRLDSPCRDGRKSEDSGQSSKTSAFKDRRGCYKRRKNSHTSTKLTPNLIDDGHAWRKYGQKVILNAKHPRNYFRCTHKFDQGCQATKQVQMTEAEPAMYKTTYHGFHTCKNPLKASQIILDSTHPASDSSYLLCFNSDRIQKSSDHHSLYPHLVKQEHKQNFPMSDYLMSPDLTTIDSPGPMTVLSPGSDHGDVISSGVYSCTASTHSSFGMDMMGSVDFDDDVFQFDF
ncbi:hypothetical protein RJ640_010361 [Escallonia rubra]|uniref:WRKY domain-containing protein n=1 Tax=Escallonia rubra TaxID=112253 RepID=A0AA88R310_9ASTE|nr:hypothetical protein RJ640_010361 [Escallonia rubra]